MKCYRNFSEIVTLEKAYHKDGRKLLPEDLSIIKNGSIVFDDAKIIWIGEDSSLPNEYKNIPSINYTGHTLTPEVVDSHTHLVFAGDRSQEYTMRLNGADYEAIAKSGGGILSTMEQTITASEDELYTSALQRILNIHSYGVGTIEIKSGYGLTLESERKISNVIQKLKDHFKDKIQILNTYMAAHAIPKSSKSSSEYIQKIVLPLMSELASSIDFVDVFQEVGYFNEDDTKAIFDHALKLGLKLKIHADEFNDNKGAILATKYSAISADHLLCTSLDGAEALSKSNTVATLLPGTAFFLGKPLANARMFLDQGCKVALASDYNPGSCHCDNLLMIASISAKTLKLNIAELWCGITLNAAHALDLKNQGALIPELQPRFSIFKCERVDLITYNWGKSFSINF